MRVADRRARSRVKTLLLALVLTGCTTTPPAASVAPTASSTAGPPATTPVPASLAPGPKLDTLVVASVVQAIDPPILLALSNAFPTGDVTRFLYNGLYKLDASLAPVPDLAAEPCAIENAGLRITCTLRPARFHDGSPVTAEDVVESYRIALSPACAFETGIGCTQTSVDEVVALDDRTIELRLNRPDPTLFTIFFPSVFVHSKRQIETDSAAYEAAMPHLDAGEYAAAADEVEAAVESGASDPARVCGPVADHAAELLAAAGFEADWAAYFEPVDSDGPPDFCALAAYLADAGLRAVAESLELDGVDRIARTFRLLDLNRHPIGTGPWKLASVEPSRLARLEAFTGHHFGSPATANVEIRLSTSADAIADQVRAGAIHWWVWVPFEYYRGLRTTPGVTFVEYPDFGFHLLAYNLRPGRLFAERALRKAMELCVDKESTVETATRGDGIPVYSPIPPASWAFQPSIPHPSRDVAAARALIEGAGWTPGLDGVYVRNGRRLAAEVFVRNDVSDRVRFLDLVAAQVKDCGIELTVSPSDARTVLGPLFEYPHIAPNRTEPFDGLFFGWVTAPDPDQPIFHSREISSSERPEGINIGGYSNPEVDRLLDAGISTYDQRERARIYRDLQLVLADDQPMLFGWSGHIREALSAGVALIDGDIDRSSLYWWWEPEKLIVRATTE